MPYNPSARNTKDSIKGIPLAAYLTGQSQHIRWDPSEHRRMQQFLVRHSLGPWDVQRLKPPRNNPILTALWESGPDAALVREIARELDCFFDKRFNDVVHPKIVSCLEYRVKEWEKAVPCVFRMVPGETRVVYEEYARAWDRPGWDGSTKPPREDKVREEEGGPADAGPLDARDGGGSVRAPDVRDVGGGVTEQPEPQRGRGLGRGQRDDQRRTDPVDDASPTHRRRSRSRRRDRDATARPGGQSGRQNESPSPASLHSLPSPPSFPRRHSSGHRRRAHSRDKTPTRLQESEDLARHPPGPPPGLSSSRHNTKHHSQWQAKPRQHSRERPRRPAASVRSDLTHSASQPVPSPDDHISYHNSDQKHSFPSPASTPQLLSRRPHSDPAPTQQRGIRHTSIHSQPSPPPTPSPNPHHPFTHPTPAHSAPARDNGFDDNTSPRLHFSHVRHRQPPPPVHSLSNPPPPRPPLSLPLTQYHSSSHALRSLTAAHKTLESQLIQHFIAYRSSSLFPPSPIPPFPFPSSPSPIPPSRPSPSPSSSSAQPDPSPFLPSAAVIAQAISTTTHQTASLTRQAEKERANRAAALEAMRNEWRTRIGRIVKRDAGRDDGRGTGVDEGLVEVLTMVGYGGEEDLLGLLGGRG
ncbi:hypothetical protein CONLIGDRAFT_674585 [Coniochaeta ligniaria NRRL 30616]|uniref:Uncharacterized protein n=1 Tax=Coniochaeta ligniaria NRRL 30616 TaxID=1408157 RepID=A0A1J7J780_9PEZI|nr:hypothetical protein CONLIGDRAFT_674585 [Coniochaeta ligniaria NRRL 30616]